MRDGLEYVWTFMSSLDTVPYGWRSWAALAPTEDLLYLQTFKDYGRSRIACDAMGLISVRVKAEDIPDAFWLPPARVQYFQAVLQSENREKAMRERQQRAKTAWDARRKKADRATNS